MKGLDPKRMSELFRSNSKTHFKMYKAGRKWLVAGISALSGLLGLGTIGSTSAKADTKTGAAKDPGYGGRCRDQDHGDDSGHITGNRASVDDGRKPID